MKIHKRSRLFPEIQRDTRTAKDIGRVKSNARFAISPVASVRTVSTYPDPNHSCVGASLRAWHPALPEITLSEGRTGKTIKQIRLWSGLWLFLTEKKSGHISREEGIKARGKIQDVDEPSGNGLDLRRN